MTIEQVSFFLSGSILVGISLIILSVCFVVINNLFFKYWKPVRIFTDDSFLVFTSRQGDSFVTETEKKKPSVAQPG